MAFDLQSFRDESTAYDPFADTPPPLPSGSFLFDYVTGVGGLPRGRIIEAFGKESSGKSTIFYQAIAAAQAEGGVGLILDYENSFVRSYGEACGMDVDPAKLLVDVPDSLESGFNLANEVTRKAGEASIPLVVLFDSLEAMPLEAENAEEDPNANNMVGAWRAKALGSRLRQSTGIIAKAGALWVLINHEKDVIHTGFVTPGQRALAGSTRTPGGRAPKYYASIRLQFTPTSKVKGNTVDPVTGEAVSDAVIAQKVRVTTVKNKLGAPNRSVVLTIRYGSGVDNAFDLVDVGLKRGVLARKSASSPIEVPGPDGTVVHTARSLQGAVDYLSTHEDVAEHIESVLRDAIEHDAKGITDE